MARSSLDRLSTVALAGLLALTASACTRDNKSATTSAQPGAGGTIYPACTTSADCSGGQVCTTIGCCPGCHSDADCGSSQTCNVAGAFCSPKSASPTPTPKPSPGSTVTPGALASCQSDGDCASGQICSVGTCAAGCSSASPCAAGQTCSAGRCYTSATSTCGTAAMALCSSDAACGAGRSCSGGSCHAQCTDSATCPLGQVCSTGLCVDDPNPTSHMTAQCLFDVDCGAAQRCINAYCHALCGNDAQCPERSFCDRGVCRANYLPAS
jgi:hypothetical protein